MKILGLITEYNPFHNGHKYHIAESKQLTKASHTLAVMSGNFVQRGEPAIIDKWTRAEFAISSGVDLVVELPTVFALGSAEYFAYGACSILNDMNIVDDLVFGSESGSIDGILKLSSTLLDSRDEINEYIGKFLGQGLSFPKAREHALRELMGSHGDSPGEEDFLNLNMPNNILGIEYAKALKHLKSDININTIKRVNADYNDTELHSYISSATAIRLAVKNDLSKDKVQGSVPDDVFRVFNNLKQEELIDSNDFSSAILPIIRRMTSDDLALIHDVSEGLENKILQEANNNTNIEDLIEALKSKRYTRTRIQRILYKILLNIKSDYMGSSYELKPRYIRVLGFNDKGREILKLLKDKSSLPVLTNIDRLDMYEKSISDMLNYDIRATNIYAAFSNIELNSDFRKRPVYKK